MMMETAKQRKTTYLQAAVSILFALLVWQLLAMRIHQKVLLASPIEVLIALKQLITEAATWKSISFSVGHFMLGFFLAFVTGILLATISARFHFFELLLWPYMQAVKATPVASFIILCLVWFPVKKLSVIISFLMVLPVVYHNFLSGIRAMDSKKREMGKVNHFSLIHRFLAIVLPQLKAALFASCSTGLAMAFKAGTAAEVIGTPAGSIGKMLYQAKIYLCTSDLMAWTVIIIVCSVLLEKLLLVLLKALYRNLEALCMKF